MIVTEIRIHLVERRLWTETPVRAYVSITFDCSFCVRDVKILDKGEGPFLVMPSRRVMDRCPACDGKNHLQANYCNDCGAAIDAEPPLGQRYYEDVCYPINADYRQYLTGIILAAYEQRLMPVAVEEVAL